MLSYCHLCTGRTAAHTFPLRPCPSCTSRMLPAAESPRPRPKRGDRCGTPRYRILPRLPRMPGRGEELPLSPDDTFVAASAAAACVWAAVCCLGREVQCPRHTWIRLRAEPVSRSEKPLIPREAASFRPRPRVTLPPLGKEPQTDPGGGLPGESRERHKNQAPQRLATVPYAKHVCWSSQGGECLDRCR